MTVSVFNATIGIVSGYLSFSTLRWTWILFLSTVLLQPRVSCCVEVDSDSVVVSRPTHPIRVLSVHAGVFKKKKKNRPGEGVSGLETIVILSRTKVVEILSGVVHIPDHLWSVNFLRSCCRVWSCSQNQF